MVVRVFIIINMEKIMEQRNLLTPNVDVFSQIASKRQI